MKHLILISMFALLTSFTTTEVDNVHITVTDDWVEYCISDNGNMYCCGAATYGEARDCAVAMMNAANER